MHGVVCFVVSPQAPVFVLLCYLHSFSYLLAERKDVFSAFVCNFEGQWFCYFICKHFYYYS